MKVFIAVLNLAEPHASSGVSDAQCMLGILYQLGTGVEPDGEKAVFWYSKAGRQGNAVALNNLGTIYLAGMPGILRDREFALSYYRQAHAAGFDRMDLSDPIP
jgi:TPR repeat protein